MTVLTDIRAHWFATRVLWGLRKSVKTRKVRFPVEFTNTVIKYSWLSKWIMNLQGWSFSGLTISITGNFSIQKSIFTLLSSVRELVLFFTILSERRFYFLIKISYEVIKTEGWNKRKLIFLRFSIVLSHDAYLFGVYISCLCSVNFHFLFRNICK